MFSILIRKRAFLVFLIQIVLIIVVGIINPLFIRVSTLSGIIDSSLIIVLIALGEMFVLLTGGIDVSVGAITGLSAVAVGLSLNAGISIPVSMILGLLAGFAAGAVNGIGVGLIGVPPIIMTLGTMGVFRGTMYILTGGSWIDHVVTSYKRIAGIDLFGISALAWIVLLLGIISALIIQKTRAGRIFHYVGDNREGAFFMGIHVKVGVFWAHVFAGLFAGLAGLVFVSQIGFIPMQTGSGQEMRAVAACVLGGVSLSGGVGGPMGALVGGLFLTTIDSILVFLKVPAFWNDAIAGAILLSVVLLDFRFRKAFEAQLKSKRAQLVLEESSLEEGAV
jgi:AI-2 transport system permease protein